MQKNKMPQKIDVGCCFRKPEGYWGTDRVQLPGVDQVFDHAKFPWPLPDSQFEEIRLWHILQFLPDTVRTMEEVWRIAKPGAKITVGVPYYASALAFGDPSHIRYFTEETFKFFTTDSWYISNQNSFTKAKFSITKQELKATGRLRKFIPGKRFLRYFMWNIVDLLVVEMEVIKEENGK